jgi:hypothetical protein
MLDNYTKTYAEIWESCPESFPEFSKSYSDTEKLEKEKVLDQFLRSIKSFRKLKMARKELTPTEERQFFSDTRSYLSDGLDFNDNQLELMFSEDMIVVTKTFINQAREFDSGLLFHDIFQACRNVWIMNGLQLIMGLPMKLTPSIFAYSMLYPYTDNLIDDPLISNLEKLLFSERFRNRLSGNSFDPKSKTEVAVFKLVGMIETEYSRIDFPEVYQSLLDIHDAQTNSMKLMQSKNSISDQETLQICMDKGGTSVLTDGYLVAGKLTAEQKYFLYGFGAYLQLLDDVQDLDEDHQAGLMTVFSKSAFCIPLDAKLNKTYWFGEDVMKSLDYFDGQHLELFKSLMRRSMDLFIAEAIAQNTDVFSLNYVFEFEKHSPFHFSYIRKQREQFSNYNGFLLTAVEDMAFAES